MGTIKYDRTPSRPVTRRRFMGDSIEEVGVLTGIRRTSPCHGSKLMWDKRLSHCANLLNILLSPFWDEARGQRNDPT
jgi:hypothetical protein